MAAYPPSALLAPVTRLSPVAELTLPALLLRGGHLPEHLVSVYLPTAPTVAFTARDLRSPGIRRATSIARAHGFTTGVRSPGGKMVAYDAGAVIVDHLSAAALPSTSAGSALFADNAAHHARVLAALAAPPIDTRVGEVPGEYCPGEYSVNVAGVVKVLGSAQRIVRQGSLFSTVIQVEFSAAVRAVIIEVSDALGYALDPTSMGGLSDFAPKLTASRVAQALRADYLERLGLVELSAPNDAVEVARSAAEAVAGELPFHVDDWVRARLH